MNNVSACGTVVQVLGGGALVVMDQEGVVHLYVEEVTLLWENEASVDHPLHSDQVIKILLLPMGMVYIMISNFIKMAD